jgi:hypothetical protein
MPKQHGKYSRHTEHQRKGEKIPLLAQKVYVWISKKFHAVVKPLFCQLDLGFSLRSLRCPWRPLRPKAFTAKCAKETAKDAKKPVTTGFNSDA